MISNDRTRYILLAIVNGVVSFLTLAALERIQILKLELRDVTEQGVGGIFYDVFGRSAFWTWPVSIFHVLLFVGATLIVRRYFLKRLGPGLFFWLVVALIVCVAWLTVVFTGIAINAGIRGESILERVLESVIYRASQQTALYFALAVVGVNFVFGAVVHLATNNLWRRQPRYS